MVMTRVAALILMSCLGAYSYADSSSCKGDPISINISLDYPNGGQFDLKGSSKKDAETTGKLAKNFSSDDKIKYLSDGDVESDADGKAKFVAKLRNLAGNSSVINLNY